MTDDMAALTATLDAIPVEAPTLSGAVGKKCRRHDWLYERWFAFGETPTDPIKQGQTVKCSRCGVFRDETRARRGKSARSVLNRAMTEDQLLTAILEAAKLYGWKAHHVRRSDKALQQGDAGFPDLVLARAGHVLFLELKREGRKATPGQTAWLDALCDGPYPCPVVGKHVIHPSDLDDVLRWLR